MSDALWYADSNKGLVTRTLPGGTPEIIDATAYAGKTRVSPSLIPSSIPAIVQTRAEDLGDADSSGLGGVPYPYWFKIGHSSQSGFQFDLTINTWSITNTSTGDVDAASAGTYSITPATSASTSNTYTNSGSLKRSINGMQRNAYVPVTFTPGGGGSPIVTNENLEIRNQSYDGPDLNFVAFLEGTFTQVDFTIGSLGSVSYMFRPQLNQFYATPFTTNWALVTPSNQDVLLREGAYAFLGTVSTFSINVDISWELKWLHCVGYPEDLR